MIEELKEDAIVHKVGGRFKLATLIQKRLIALNQGARSHIADTRGADKFEIVIQEIMQDKIELAFNAPRPAPADDYEPMVNETIDLSQPPFPES